MRELLSQFASLQRRPSSLRLEFYPLMSQRVDRGVYLGVEGIELLLEDDIPCRLGASVLGEAGVAREGGSQGLEELRFCRRGPTRGKIKGV